MTLILSTLLDVRLILELAMVSAPRIMKLCPMMPISVSCPATDELSTGWVTNDRIINERGINKIRCMMANDRDDRDDDFGGDCGEEDDIGFIVEVNI